MTPEKLCLEKMTNMKVVTKYTYPKTGTRNNRIYPPEVLEAAFSSWPFSEFCEDSIIEVKTEADEVIGLATAQLENGYTVTVEAEIDRSEYINLIKEVGASYVGFILAGYGKLEFKDDKYIVSDLSFDRVALVRNSAVDYTTEILDESTQGPVGYNPWILDDFGYNKHFRTELIE